MNGGGMFASLLRREAVKNGTKRTGNLTADNTQATLSTVTPSPKSSSSKNAAAAVTNSGKNSIFRTTAPGAWEQYQDYRLFEPF